MSEHIERVRVLDDRPVDITHDASDLDSRNALSVASRDLMISMRREAGLSDYPPEPLVPEFVPNFLPNDDRVAAD